ncbi:hypothetical protein E8E12_004963, partial [Didymella heteroderae]
MCWPDPIDHERVRIHEDVSDFGRIKPDDPDTRAGFNIAESFEWLQNGNSYIVTAAILYPDDKLGKVIARQDRGRKTRCEIRMPPDENSNVQAA